MIPVLRPTIQLTLRFVETSQEPLQTLKSKSISSSIISFWRHFAFSEGFTLRVDPFAQ
jgi:hypothetical protein